MPIQLTLIAHAATAATRATRFPTPADQLDPASTAQAAALATTIRRLDAAWVSPARAACQTIDALGLTATETPQLRDLDVGLWSGRTMDDLDPAALNAWLTDPTATPHGGESITNFIARTAAWLQSLDPATPRILAVAHASTLRAALVTALAAPPSAFWRIDAAPLQCLRLNGTATTWTLRSITPLQALSPREKVG